MTEEKTPIQELKELIPELEIQGIYNPELDVVKKVLEIKSPKPDDPFLQESAFYLIKAANQDYRGDERARMVLFKAAGLIGRLI